MFVNLKYRVFVLGETRNGNASDPFGMPSFVGGGAKTPATVGADSAESQTSAELLDLQV